MVDSVNSGSGTQSTASYNPLRRKTNPPSQRRLHPGFSSGYSSEDSVSYSSEDGSAQPQDSSVETGFSSCQHPQIPGIFFKKPLIPNFQAFGQ